MRRNKYRSHLKSFPTGHVNRRINLIRDRTCQPKNLSGISRPNPKPRYSKRLSLINIKFGFKSLTESDLNS